MRVFADLTRFIGRSTHDELEAKLTQLENAGVTGVSVWDHYFTTHTSTTDNWREGEVKKPSPADPLTGLALVAGINPRLEVHTAVVNSEWIHPALLFRQYAQIGASIGGDRVTAGLGTGWNNEEFDALGMKKAKFRDRALRLKDAMRLGRDLFDTGMADFEGDYFSVRRLPLSPDPVTAPRLLIAGSSEMACETAGKYADILSLYGHPKYGTLRGQEREKLHSVDTYRRINMTDDDAVDRMQLANSHADAAGRSGKLSASVHIFYAMYGTDSQVDRLEKQICNEYGHVEQHDLSDNPYMLKGEPQQIADKLQERKERFGLSELVFRPEFDDVPGAVSDPIAFCEKVLPLM